MKPDHKLLNELKLIKSGFVLPLSIDDKVDLCWKTFSKLRQVLSEKKFPEKVTQQFRTKLEPLWIDTWTEKDLNKVFLSLKHFLEIIMSNVQSKQP